MQIILPTIRDLISLNILSVITEYQTSFFYRNKTDHKSLLRLVIRIGIMLIKPHIRENSNVYIFSLQRNS